MTEMDAPTHAEPETEPEMQGAPSSSATRGIGVAAVVIVALAAGLLVWLLAIRDDGSATKTTNRPNAPAAATEEELKELAAEVDHPVYWAGPSEDDTYELTRTRGGGIYIRYLPEGVEVGDPRPRFTTVGTYPAAAAFRTVREGARRTDAKAYRFKSGAIAVTYAKTPSSVFFAFPSSPYLVEVFDRSPARAVQLVTSGQVQLIK